MPEPIDTSLVRIHTKAGGVVGAGFLVGERHILTCAHVMAQALGLPDDAIAPPSSTVSLDFPQLAPHTLLTARVIFWDPVRDDNQGDIAGLELLDAPPAGAEAVHFVWADQFWDHPFRTLGFPKGYDDGVWATGRLLGRQGANWIQLEDVKTEGFAVISGFSGAPVWDAQLQGIVGMIVASSQLATTKTAFVIPSDVLLASWPELASLMLPPVPRNPYKGLRAFTEHDTGDFFGRDSLTDELVTAVETTLTREQKEGQHARLMAVVLGPSGSGKSSVMMAGLIPRLRAGKVLNSNEWVYLDPIIPGTDPLEALTITLKSHFPDTSFKTLREDLEGDTSNGLYLLATQLVKKKEAKVVLLIDQFEEIFTLLTDETERQHFFELLVTAVTEPRSPLFVILTLRADFYDRPMSYPELYRLIDDHHVSVLPMQREDLRRVIEEPANLPDVQLTFESELVNELLLEMQGQSGALPLLEFTLDQLVQRRNGYLLTLQAYREMGGVKGALSRHAEQTYQALPSNEHRQRAREMFLRLVSPGTTEQDTTRRRAAHSEFERADPVQTQQMQEILETFTKARLLTTNQVSGKTTIEVSHEALIREWKQLPEWLHEARNDILFQQSLSEDVMEWEQRKKPRDRLYRGVQLKEAQAWARRNRPSKQEIAFIQASASRQTLSLVSLIVVVLLLVSSLGIAGWYLFLQPKPTLVTTLQDNNEVGSLRWCVNNAPSGSKITFAQSMRGTIELTGGDLEFAAGKRLTLVGPGVNQLTISGGDANAHVHVSKGATLSISDLSFKNSVTSVDGFLFNAGTLTLTNSIISGNKTTANVTSYGGGIYNENILTVINSTISNNTSRGVNQGGEGGGIFNQSGKLTVIHSTFSNNLVIGGSRGGYGGGINNFHGTVTVINSTFSNNSVRGKQYSSGGGIDNSAKLTVINSTFSNNSVSSDNAWGFAGGIANHETEDRTETGTVVVSNSTFSNNSASGKQGGQSGGIDNKGKLTVSNSTFSNNSASSNNAWGIGGAITNLDASMLLVNNSTFSNNSASGKQGGQGGGIANGGMLTMSNSTFSGNSASGMQAEGGGIADLGPKDFSAIIHFCTIYRNFSINGGGIWIDPTGSPITISRSIIAANEASGGPDISGALISGGYNLIENVAGATGLNAGTYRQVTRSDLKLDPTLRNNGGPTHTNVRSKRCF